MDSQELTECFAAAIASLQDSAGGLLFVKFPAHEPEKDYDDSLLDLNTENEAPGTMGRYGGGTQDAILMDNPSQSNV